MTGRSEDVATEFLNIDLDIQGDARDIELYLKSVEAAVVVVNHTGRHASVELAKEFASLDETMRGLIDLIGALPPEARNVWGRLDSRSLNVGIQCAAKPHAASFAISAETVESMASLGFEIVFTVYAPAR